MVIGIVQWIILIIDILLIHEFTVIYKQIIISASVFTIIGFPLYVYDEYWKYKHGY
jgi:hypothetical protein